MLQTAIALKTFFSGFDLPAYTVESVPDDVALPYIAYSLPQPEWNQKATLYCQVWDHATSNSFILQKADEIIGEIGLGKRIHTEDGLIVIWTENPMIQLMVEGDYRSVYINLSLNSYQMPGV